MIGGMIFMDVKEMRVFLFEKEFRFFGLKRSGNNAMIMYMSGHFNPKKIFLVVPNTDFDFQSRTGKWGPFTFSERLDLLEKAAPGETKYFMTTTENYDLAEIRRRDDDKKYSFNKHRKWYVRKYGVTHFARAAYSVPLLRSPHNNLASIMEKGWSGRHAPDFAEKWVMYAKEVIGETNYLNGKVPCLFDKWFSSLEYREEFCANLGLDHNDSGLNDIRHGRQSSFDGAKYRKEAQKMKVLDRWKLYRKNEEYLEVLRNEELIDLTERLFGYNLREILDL
jgi:hypothetical protein